MKVGDLVRYIPSNVLGLIVQQDEWATLVRWFDEIGETEDIRNYEGELEVINESG